MTRTSSAKIAPWFQPIRGAAQFNAAALYPAGRGYHGRQAGPRVAASDRAGNDRGHRGQPHRGSRGGGASARRGARHHPPGRRGLRCGKCPPPVPDPISTRAPRCGKCSTYSGIAHRHGDRSGGFAADRATPAAPKKVSECFDADRRVDRARREGRRSGFRFPLRTSPMRPAIRNSDRFLEYLGRFIIPRRRRCGALTRRCSARAHLATFQHEHRLILDAIRARAVKRARGAMQSTSPTAAGATRSSLPAEGKS